MELSGTIGDSGPGSAFASWHRWDAVAFPLFVAAIWAGLLGGFVPDIVLHFSQGKPAYPLIVHVHALFFTSWPVLLTVQVALIRTQRVALHRKLGLAGAFIALAMVILGPATAYVVQNRNWGTPASDPAFLRIQLTDIAAFGAMVAAGLLLRRDSASHKRLMLLGSLYITDAGFGRMFGIFFQGLGGGGWWGFFVEGSLQPDILILALGLYDLATRGRLHRVYLSAVAWLALMQISSITLYYNANWGVIARHLLGH